MKYFVIDASVVLKALLKESDTVIKKFTKILKEAQNGQAVLLSSKFLAIEIANGLRFTVKDKEEALKIFKDFMRLPIKTLVLTSSQKEKALLTSYDLGTTVYDTSYHVLSKSYDAVFLTSDKSYYDKAKELGQIEFIG